MIEAMAGSATPQTSSTGWGALRAANWEGARAAFEAELADRETAAALDGLARARWWLSDIPGAVEAWERAYTGYRRAGLDEPAAHVAILLSREHAEGLGNDALANGWLARARDLLGGHPDSIQWGWVALVESERAVDPTAALEHAERALELIKARTSGSGVELRAPTPTQEVLVPHRNAPQSGDPTRVSDPSTGPQCGRSFGPSSPDWV
jgi:hypothetical protein